MVLTKLKSQVVAGNGTLHHGVPVLSIRVGDAVPTPRAPTRYAVLVNPDLARYLLAFNHPNNRNRKQRRVSLYAGDMIAGRWQFSPESVIFSTTGVLMDGQNRLMAITEAGTPQWLLFDFGWPIELMSILDRGKARTNADGLHTEGKINATAVAALIALVSRYDQAVGQTRGFSGLPIPSSAANLEILNGDEEAYQEAARAGQRTYKALGRGGTGTVWAAAYYIIYRIRPAEVVPFFDEIHNGTGAPGSVTRVLAGWFIRRPLSMTRSGDDREPLELVIRAFNAWRTGKAYSAVRSRGFLLSHVR